MDMTAQTDGSTPILASAMFIDLVDHGRRHWLVHIHCFIVVNACSVHVYWVLTVTGEK